MRNPDLPCARAPRDDALIPYIQKVWRVNMQVYGADKVCKLMRRKCIALARCTVERFLCHLGQRSARRGKVVRTTVGDANAPCPVELWQRFV